MEGKWDHIEPYETELDGPIANIALLPCLEYSAGRLGESTSTVARPTIQDGGPSIRKVCLLNSCCGEGFGGCSACNSSELEVDSSSQQEPCAHVMSNSRKNEMPSLLTRSIRKPGVQRHSLHHCSDSLHHIVDVRYALWIHTYRECDATVKSSVNTCTRQ
eukprot:3743851-Amphidinium_carterae.1